MVLGAWCLVLGAWCLVLGAWCLVVRGWLKKKKKKEKNVKNVKKKEKGEEDNVGSPSGVRLLGGSQCLQPSKRILAPNTRKLPHPAWGPNPRRTGRRQQEWASKQRPPSETGSSLQDAVGNSSREKPRNGHGTNLERSKKALELPRTASEGSQKGTGTKLALFSLPTHPHTTRGLGVEGPPSP